LFQTRFPRFYRKWSGDRDVSARATHLKAAMENVFMTTTERKRMSTKTTFKRIALVAVAALGLGVFSSVPSNAYLSAATTTMTLSASSGSAAPGETVTATVQVDFTSTWAAESVTVVVDSATSGVTPTFLGLKADSANVNTTQPSSGFNTSTYVGATSTGVHIASKASDTTPTAVRAKMTLSFAASTSASAGTYVYTVTLRQTYGGTTTNIQTLPYTLTVTAKDLTAVATKSKLWVNASSANADQAFLATTPTGVGIEADSSIVASANTAITGASTATRVGYMFAVFNNASDTKTVSGSSVTGSLVVTISGPGSLEKSTAAGTLAKSVTITASSDTITIWSDGTPGTATITGFIGSNELSQGAKTVVFNGKATAITATVETKVVTTGATAKNAISFTAKDSAGNVVKTAAMNRNAGFFVLFADTKVVGGTSATAVDASATPAYYACNAYQTTYSKFTCDVPVTDSGVATVYIADSYTVASSSVISAALTITVSGAGFTGTISTDKTTYAPGEKAIITVTGKDRGGRPVVDGEASLFTNGKWGSLSANFASGSETVYYGGTGSSFVNGVDTYVVYMPSVAGTYVYSGMTSGETVTASTLYTFTVVDATKDAADAATDAALEATDAAYAAQDAAQLAAEAADAATAAAEAATAAVEDLATQVAALFADLQKQITTLANVVAKIAKKVKA